MVRWLLFLAVASAAEESFITPQEYAAQLYHNPRGIGCQLCHGENGGGRVIARYRDHGRPGTFAAPSIREMDFDDFDAALSRRIKGMPKYYLTSGERRALYLYLHPETAKENDVSQ